MTVGSFERDCQATARALGWTPGRWVRGAQNLVAVAPGRVLRFPIYQRDADRIEEIAQRYRLAHTFGLRAPRVLAWSGGRIGRARVELAGIKGSALAEAVQRLPSADVPVLLAQLAGQLQAMRAVRPEAWPFPGENWVTLWGDLPARLARLQALLPAEQVPGWRRAADRAARQATEHPLSLVHGDFQDQNIRVDADGRLGGVLDWDTAVVGDPAVDTAAVLHSLGADWAARMQTDYSWIAEDMSRFAGYADCWPVLHALWQAGDQHWLFTAADAAGGA